MTVNQYCYLNDFLESFIFIVTTLLTAISYRPASEWYTEQTFHTFVKSFPDIALASISVSAAQDCNVRCRGHNKRMRVLLIYCDKKTILKTLWNKDIARKKGKLCSFRFEMRPFLECSWTIFASSWPTWDICLWAPLPCCFNFCKDLSRILSPSEFSRNYDKTFCTPLIMSNFIPLPFQIDHAFNQFEKNVLNNKFGFY